jgi:hypothetical protein
MLPARNFTSAKNPIADRKVDAVDIVQRDARTINNADAIRTSQ